MGLSHSRPTLTTTALQISSNHGGKDGQSISIQNPAGGATVYIGGSSVTSSSYGFALTENSAMSIDLQNGETLYGIVASGTQQVNVLIQGV